MTRKGDKQLRWTEEQEQMIRERYSTTPAKQLAAELGVTLHALHHKAKLLGVRFRSFSWTKEMLQTLRDRYQTDGPAKLALEFGTTPIAVTAKARRLGIGSTRKLPPKDFQWTPEREEEMRQRYTKEGGQVLAEQWGVHLSCIQRKATELGLKTNAGHVRWGAEMAASNTTLDIHYFDQWSPSVAYCFGFFMADACMDKTRRTVTINLKREDEEVLHYVKKELKSQLDVYFTEARGNDSPQAHLGLYSQVLCSRLSEMGMHPRKTFNDDPFPEVPPEVLPHFVRGYFDGDGSANLSICRGHDFCTVNFVGSPRFITGLRDALVEKVGMATHPVRTKQGKTAEWSTVAWTANKDIRLFRDFIYPDGFSFCLQRKKDILDKWLSQPRTEMSYRPWTEEEKDQVRNLFRVLGATKLSRLMGRNRVVVIDQAKALGVYVRKNKGKDAPSTPTDNPPPTQE